MRKVIDLQPSLFCPTIDQIKFDLYSRDEIPELLMGLQAIYKDKEAREAIFELLMQLVISKEINPEKGRKGMDLWTIFVLGNLRLNCNIDFDKLHELANEHRTLRMMIGHGPFDDKRYPLQTIKDNVSLLTPEILAKTNKIIVDFGHKIVGKKTDEPLKGSCDSFVLETDVHFPTDISICFDAVRKTLETIGTLCGILGIPGRRENQNNIRKVKIKLRKASKLKRSSSKNEEKQKLLKEYFTVIMDEKISGMNHASTDLAQAAKMITTIFNFLSPKYK